MPTTIKFESAQIISIGDKEYLAVELKDYPAKIAAKKFVADMKSKVYELTVKLFRDKRSLEANAKAWKLINSLAQELGLNPVDVYRRHVEEIGNFEQYLMIEAAYEDFDKAWTYNHLGRYSKIIGESREKKGYVWVAAFKGSSSFDTKTMYHFIENIIFECKQFGVEYLSPDELERVMSNHEKYQDKVA